MILLGWGCVFLGQLFLSSVSGLCFAIDEWEFVGLIPMAIGLILMAIAEKKASALALAQAGSFAQMEKQAPRPSQQQLPTADKMELSSEVLQLLERLNRSSKLR